MRNEPGVEIDQQFANGIRTFLRQLSYPSS
jgi:hypothetical protein